MLSDSKVLKNSHRKQNTGLSLKDFARNYYSLSQDSDPQSGESYNKYDIVQCAVRWCDRKGVKCDPTSR